MSLSFTPEQFHEYQQQSTQQVADGDVEGQRRKQNAGYWVAYCYYYGTGGISDEDRDANCEDAQWILEHVIQEQDGIDADNIHDNTGKHRYLLAWLVRWLQGDDARSSRLYRQAFPRLEMEVQEGGNDENYQEAAFCLGQGLFEGRGVDKDFIQGIHWWKSAAEMGHTEAQFAIEVNCFRDPFVAEIFSWLQQLELQNNNPWAQLNLGRCHEDGHGVKKDLVKAVEWYSKAIAHGHDRAPRWKQRLLRELDPQERSKILGCVVRNQKIEKARSLMQQSFLGAVPLSLWAHALASFQHQENPPWEGPSPTFISLKDGIMPQLQKLLSNKSQKKRKKHGG